MGKYKRRKPLIGKLYQATYFPNREELTFNTKEPDVGMTLFWDPTKLDPASIDEYLIALGDIWPKCLKFSEEVGLAFLRYHSYN